jgi:hypothetical protein
MKRVPSKLKTAAASLTLAVGAALGAWYFASRQAAFWSTGEKLSLADARRAQTLSNLFLILAALGLLCGIALLWSYYRSRAKGR